MFLTFYEFCKLSYNHFLMKTKLKVKLEKLGKDFYLNFSIDSIEG